MLLTLTSYNKRLHTTFMLAVFSVVAFQASTWVVRPVTMSNTTASIFTLLTSFVPSIWIYLAYRWKKKMLRIRRYFFPIWCVLYLRIEIKSLHSLFRDRHQSIIFIQNVKKNRYLLKVMLKNLPKFCSISIV